MREKEVRKIMKKFMEKEFPRRTIRTGKSREAGPDFEFEDGSTMELKSSDFSDKERFIGQLVKYGSVSKRLGVAMPVDAMTVQIMYWLYLCEKIIKFWKIGGEEFRIPVYLVKRKEGEGRVIRWRSAERCFDRLTSDLKSKFAKQYSQESSLTS